MATVTVNIDKKKDLEVLREILNRFGLSYQVAEDTDYAFSEAEIKDLVQTKQDFYAGKTTARDWHDIEKDLKNAFG